MFSNIGKKLKLLAQVVTWVGIIGSIITGFVLICLWAEYRYAPIYLGLGIGIPFGGSLVSWIISWFIYGYGDFIENTAKIARNTSWIAHAEVLSEKRKKYTDDENGIPKISVKRIEDLRITIAFIAIIPAFYTIYNMIGTIINYIIYVFEYFTILYSISNVISLIAPVAAMILCSIYLFVFYGKKRDALWGVSLILFAAGKFFYIIPDTLDLIQQLVYYGINAAWQDPRITFHIAHSSLTIIIGVVFTIMAILHFMKAHTPSKTLPVVAASLAILLFVLDPIGRVFFEYSFTFNTEFVFGAIFDLMHYVPYVMFYLFCPLDYVRERIIQNS